MADVRVFETAAELAREMAGIHVEAAATALASGAGGRLSIALTGGSAANLYAELAPALPQRRVQIWFGDERCVPPDHADSNMRLAREKLLSRLELPDGSLHRMRGEDDPDAAARAYEAELLDATDGGAIDLVHLGMGPDGHVCSLFPGHALLQEKERLVAAIHDSPKPPAARITLTLPCLAKAKRALFLVLGESKADAVRAAIEDPASTLPAALVHRMGHATWLLDRAAASKIEATKLKTRPT